LTYFEGRFGDNTIEINSYNKTKYTIKENNMNRNAKIQKLYDKRLKRARAKLKTSSKPAYISKADRAAAELENSANPSQV